MKKILQVLVVVWLSSIAHPLWAQTRTVTGKVTSADDGTALPGVNVVIKGTSVGTTTNAEGSYTLSNVADDATLVFSFIGLTTEEILVGNRSTIDVELVPDVQSLSEVVVVGYGEQSRKTLTSSITTINAENIANLATPSFDQQLAGRAAGVQVTTGSGVLGTPPVIRIRGTNSISSGASPLVVVDNVPIITGSQSGVTPTNPLGDINPADIESIEVLKDGAATAIYGSRAANGVILITTKRGKKAAGLNVNFDTQLGFSDPITRFDLLNADEFILIANEKFANNGQPAQAFPGPDNVNTDWQDEILRRGFFQNYNLNFSGGSEKTSYFFSAGYTDQTGSIVANLQKRFTARASIDHSLNKWLDMGTSLSLARTQNTGLNSGTNALSGNIAGAARMFPNVPVYDAANPTGYNITPNGQALGRGNNLTDITNFYTNIRFVLDNNLFRANTNRLLSNSYVQLNLFDGLSLRTQYGIDYLGLRDFQSLDPRHGDGRSSNGVISQTSRDVLRWNWQNILSYNKSFGAHTVGVTLGAEYQSTITESVTAGGSNFADRYFLQENLITGTYGTQNSSGTYVPNGFDSYFGRINYALRDRYLLGFSVRNDGISALPEANRRGTFLGGSVGYRVSEEDFYKNSALANIVNELKIRASYAEVGNVDIGSFPYVDNFGSAQYASQNGIAYTQAGNPDLQWEASKKLDVGVDLGFLNDRITGSVDYFQNNVDNLILATPTPSSIGIPDNSISRNVGSMINRGIEAQVGADVISNDNFRWNVNVNFTSINNEILSLNKGLDGQDQDILFAYHVNRVGSAVGSLYGFESAGVNPANGNPMYEKGDGRIVQRIISATSVGNNGLYAFYNPENPADVSGTTGAALNFADVSDGGDRRILGNTNPTWFGGVTNSFSYKGFDLEVFVRYSGGNYLMNATRQETLLNQDFQNGGKELLERWTTPGQQTDVPKVRIGNTSITNLSGNATSRFVEKGDFVRVQNIILGYTFPETFLQKTANVFPIRSLRVYAQMQNAFTFTNYSGLDPELNNNATGSSLNVNSQFGLDFNTNPILRTTTFGINIGI